MVAKRRSGRTVGERIVEDIERAIGSGFDVDRLRAEPIIRGVDPGSGRDRTVGTLFGYPFRWGTVGDDEPRPECFFFDPRKRADDIREQLRRGNRIRIRYTDADGVERTEDFRVFPGTGRVERVFVDGRVGKVIDPGFITTFENPTGARAIELTPGEPLSGFPVGRENFSIGFKGENVTTKHIPTFSGYDALKFRRWYDAIVKASEKWKNSFCFGQVKTERITVTKLDAGEWGGVQYETDDGKRLIPTGYVVADEARQCIENLQEAITACKEEIAEFQGLYAGKVEELRRAKDELQGARERLIEERIEYSELSDRMKRRAVEFNWLKNQVRGTVIGKAFDEYRKRKKKRAKR